MDLDRPSAFTTSTEAIVARDSYALASTTFLPTDDTHGKPVVIIGSATAVPLSYYRAFAEALAQRGHPVVTFDYRGVAGSMPRAPMTLRNFPYRNRTWGTVDIPSVIDWVLARFPGRALHWVGHSFGGFGFGLADNNRHIARALNVATPFSYWGQMDGLEKYRIAALAHVGMPLTGLVMGRLPGRFLGGADLPRAVMGEWAQWLRSPTMFFEDASLPERENFAQVRAAMLFLRITDDPWATDIGMAEWQKRFSGANITIERVSPTDAGVQTIGHLNYFKPRFKDTLWPRALDWLT